MNKKEIKKNLKEFQAILKGIYNNTDGVHRALSLMLGETSIHSDDASRGVAEAMEAITMCKRRMTVAMIAMEDAENVL